jgi:sugar phosphate isomerase/epimerase
MKVSIVSDEVSSDPETAFEIIHSWGVEYVELRGIGEERYPQVSDYWHRRLPDLLREFDLKVAAISPGTFQKPFPHPAPPMFFSRKGDRRAVEEESARRAALEHDLHVVLPASIEAARRLGTRTIITFNFARMDHMASPPASEAMIAVLREAADMVAAAGMQLLVEVTEPTARPTDMVRRADHPALGLNWDPVAAFLGGDDRTYPEGFAAARPYIRHVHFKDGRINPQTGEREMLADGVLDWRGTLRDLAADGFDGFLSVETHFRPKVAGTRSCLDRLRTLVDEVQSVTA